MRFVLLLIAAIVAVVAGVAALRLTSHRAAEPHPAAVASQSSSNVSTVDVLVAKTAIPVGTVIDRSMVDKQPWPENLVLDGFIVAGSKDSDIFGKVTRAPLLAREPFISSKLASPNDASFLAASLPSGKVAVTIATNAVDGVAGYVFPGDRVDVLFTHNVPAEIHAAQQGGKAAANVSRKPSVAEVLVPDARVLAINIRPLSGKENSAAIAPSSITVEVGEDQAQQLRLAEKNGTLSLALRSLKDQKNATEPLPTLLTNLTRVQMEAAPSNAVRIIRGAGKDSDAQSGAVPGIVPNVSGEADDFTVPPPDAAGSPAMTTDQ